MLWSEFVSSSLIFQRVILPCTLLVASFKSVAFAYPIVESCFIAWFVHDMNVFTDYVFFYLLSPVVVSGQDVNLALLYIVIITRTLFPCCSILSTLFRYSIGPNLSQYMLNNIITVSPLVIFRVMVSSSECFDTNIASTSLFLIVIAFYFEPPLLCKFCNLCLFPPHFLDEFTAPVYILYLLYCPLRISLGLMLPSSMLNVDLCAF